MFREQEAEVHLLQPVTPQLLAQVKQQRHHLTHRTQLTERPVFMNR